MCAHSYLFDTTKRIHRSPTISKQSLRCNLFGTTSSKQPPRRSLLFEATSSTNLLESEAPKPPLRNNLFQATSSKHPQGSLLDVRWSKKPPRESSRQAPRGTHLEQPPRGSLAEGTSWGSFTETDFEAASSRQLPRGSLLEAAFSR